MSNAAPIVLFVYARLHHTKKTIDTLKKNSLASKSELFIYSDAAKTENESVFVQEVRDYIKTIKGFKNISIFERENNMGLAKSIIDGVTKIVNEYGKVIVIEDDLEVSPYFLSYMNSSLEIYKNESSVMHVSGFMFPISVDKNTAETLFFRAASCWGWATWKRAWKYFDSDACSLLKQIQERKLEHEFNIQGVTDYVGMLKKQIDGAIDSWAIRWYASVFVNGGLCLHPSQSLVQNIGNDGTGEHCDSNDNFVVDVNNDGIHVEWQSIEESEEGLGKIKQFYLSLRQPIHVLVYNKLHNYSSKLISRIIK